MNDSMGQYGLASVKSEGMTSSYDDSEIKPWNGYQDEFSVWFDSKYKFVFGTKWLKPIVKKFASSAWDNALLTNAKNKCQSS